MSASPRPRSAVVLILITIACASGASAAPASALSPIKPICKAAGLLSGIAGKACAVVRSPGRLFKAGKNLLGGHVGAAVNNLVGDAAGAGGATASTAIGLAAIGAWVLGGAKFALDETAKVMAETTSPQLRTTWFSGTYWRMAGISAVLTLPFLFAAAVQALIRSDLGLLMRAAFGYLPLAMLAVSIAAPLTMLLLAASDEMSAVVSSAAGNASAHFLGAASLRVGALTAISGSPFLAFLIGVFTVAGAVALWIELLMRETAVYVIVLMLPLAFSAFVWPARRVWAVRAVELLVALIVSKFAIVAVLSLGGAAIGSDVGHQSVTSWLAGLVLVLMAAFTPWAMLRLVPLAEIASGAAGSLRGEARALRGPLETADAAARAGEDWAASTTAQMRRDAQAAPADAPSADSAAAAQTERLGDLRQATPTPGAQAGAGSAPGVGGPTAAGDPGAGEYPGGGDLGAGGYPGGGDPGPGEHPGGGAPGGGAGGGGEHPGARNPGGSDERGMGPDWGAEPYAWTPVQIDEFPAPDRGSGAASPARTGNTATATGDDHDPTPGPQEPAEGRL